MPTRALLVLVAVAALTIQPFTSRSALAAPIKKRFVPPASNVALYAPVAPVVHPNGRFFFVVVRNRLLCTVDAVTGEYVQSLDLGFDLSNALASHPLAPISISEDGSVLGLLAGGAARFFTVTREGVVTALSQYPTPTDSGMPIWLSANGSMAILASGPSGVVATVRTSTGVELDSVPLSVSETPLNTTYSSSSMTIGVATARNILIFRHDERGKLKQKGLYRRDTAAGDPFVDVQTLGRRGRVLWTIEDTGRALIGLNIRNGKETARAAPESQDEFAPPLAVSPDARSVVVTAVRPGTSDPVAFYFFEAKERGLTDRKPRRMELPEDLGRLERLMFDPTGAYLVALFPDTDTIALLDAAERTLIGTTYLVAHPGGMAFTPDGDALIVTGFPLAQVGGEPTASGVTIFPVSKRGFAESSRIVFKDLPGALFTAGDRAITFQNKSYALASASAAGGLYSFHLDTLATIDSLELGVSNGFVAVAPDAHTLVVSAGGGTRIVYLEDTGHFRLIGGVTAGAVPDPIAPSVAFHPSQPWAYVTSGESVWRFDLETGESEEFSFGEAGTKITNPVVDSAGHRLYAIVNGTTFLRLAVDGLGGLSRVNAYVLEATLDQAAPRVAYDSTSSYLWCADGDVVRAYDTLFGIEIGASQPRAIGRDVVLVGQGLLAALPDGPGNVVFFDVSNVSPVYVGEVAVDAAPFSPIAGGSPAVDVATSTIYLPLVGSRKVVAISAPNGPVTTLDSDVAAAHLSVVSPSRRLAYPDLGVFPGSVVILSEP
jgi:hypothetical protein